MLLILWETIDLYIYYMDVYKIDFDFLFIVERVGEID